MKHASTSSTPDTSVLRGASLIAGSMLVLLACVPQPAAAQNAPDFGTNVYIFDSTMPNATIQSTLVSLANEAQFSGNRYAVLFKPGSYAVQSEVGYYESVAGLGLSPQAVTINGYLTANQTDNNGNLTDNFWRSLENLEINYAGTLQWGVSQGAAFRRMYVNGPLQLTNTYCGQSSGGFIADTVVVGNVNPCSQQQWYTRNSSLGSWAGGVWNMVFSGVQGAPIPNYPTNSYTVLPTTPVSREKSFLYVDNNGGYNVFVPTAQTNSVGTTWSNGNAPGYSLPISTFFIAKPTTPLADINLALSYGQNLILTPGIYQYSGSINVTNPNTIVLGLGYATLVPQTGTAAITVADVDGVQIAGGLILDAGPVNSPVLLQVGTPGGTGVSHQMNPTSINDVFFRIGGATTGSATTSLEVDSNNVILDNIWAWRADHGQTPVGWTVNTASHGVVVNGNNVTALGLAVEHYQQNQVVWNGNGGETIFYQSELPYDVPSQSAWMNGSANGYSSYAVSSSVTSHAAYGVGVYSYFNQGVNILEDSAITVPDTTGVSVTDAVSVFLSGSGSISATVNHAGTPAKSGAITSYLPFYQGVACSTTCPATPGNVTASTISPTQINLNWSGSNSPSVVYKIFRGTTSGFTPSLSNQLTSGATGTSFADTTAAASSTYYYVVEASSSAGISAGSSLASATTPATGGTITTDVLDIDSGYTGTVPPAHWVADVDYTGGAPGSPGTSAITIPGSIANPAPQAVYQTARTGNNFSYSVPGLTAGGSYIVDLHFAETYFSTTGSRRFNVAVNGTQVLSNFDIVAAAGGKNVATVQSFYAVADQTGKVGIQFTAGSANNPQVNGIEIGLGSIPVPAAPTNVTALTVSAGQVNVSWTASATPGVVYEVFRSVTPGFSPSPATLVATTMSPAFADVGLAASTAYYYVVEASNSFLTSLASNQGSATTAAAGISPLSAPAAPLGLGANAVSSSQINLLWTGSSTPGVQYKVFRSTMSGFTPSSATLLTTTSSTDFLDTGVAGSTTYYYEVEASNAAVASVPSNQASASTTQAPIVTAPTVALTTRATLVALSSGYQAVITVLNSGTSSATNVQLTAASLGAAVGASLPQAGGTIAAGQSITFTLTFPAGAGANGTGALERYAGTYTGGTFAATIRAALPLVTTY